MHSHHVMREAHESGAIYAAIIFAEHSLGKTRYGSLAGLAIAGVRGILMLIVLKCRRGAPPIDASEQPKEKP